MKKFRRCNLLLITSSLFGYCKKFYATIKACKNLNIIQL